MGRTESTSAPPGFEGLFTSRFIEYADADICGTLDPPAEELVHRIHLVASPEPGLVTVCGSKEGWRFLPGGRREPGETLDEVIGREMMEEAGSTAVGAPRVFFSHVATSRRVEPYRPHVPHPVMWWIYAFTRSRVVGAPTCPEDCEQITDVLHLPVAEAIDWLADYEPDGGHAEVVRLAAHLGLV